MSKKVYKSIILVIFIFTFANILITHHSQNISYQGEVVAVMSSNDENKNEKEKIEKPKGIDYTKTYWNLDKLYSSDGKWSEDLSKFKKDCNELKNYVGKATKSNMHLNFALEIKEKLDIRLEKLYGYVKLKQDTNKNNYKYLGMNEDLKRVYGNYNKICSDLELEILKLSDFEFKQVMNEKKISSKYGMYLKEIRRNKDHYLDEKSEDLLSDTMGLASLPGEVYELFKNMDKKTNMNPSEYRTAIEGYSRENRKLAFQSEYLAYNDNINMLSGLLIGQVKKNEFYAQQRGYKSSLNMYLKSENIDEKIYDNLIDTVNKNLEGLHKYVTLRKNLLKIDKVHSYDMYAPIVEPVNSTITYEKAQGIVYAALSPLGKEYGDALYKAFNEKWIDVYSNENKVGGAYCLSIYENHPYILLNYNNSLGSVSTLAHELGHGVYEYISSKNQNYFNSNPSIFTHEVASTTNEALLYEVLIRNAKNDKEKAYYITQYLDLIKDTLYIQTMYSEFEKTIHDMVEKQKNINALVLDDIWGQLLTKYYGPDYKLDQLSKVGWSRIPHFYNSFYVYKYATGCSAGVSFAKDILKNGSDEYMEFLKRGSSTYPIETLSKAGVNLKSTKPIEDAIDKFNSLVKELEEITKS